MNLNEFLGHDAIGLPRPCADSYPQALGDLLDEFLAMAASVKDRRISPSEWGRVVEHAKGLAGSVKGALDLALRGFIRHAVDLLENALDGSWSFIQDVRRGPSRGGAERFYRVRLVEPSLRSDGARAKDFFHIPFEKRHLVQRQRFSYPGIPCLYLGQSVYCCWKELGEPDLNSLLISKFEVAPGQSVSLLDFGWRPHWIAHQLEQDHDDCLAWALANVALWPLVAASAFRRRHGTSPFVCEYLIPQMLTEILVSSPFMKGTDGIRYVSVNVPDPAIGLEGTCVVLPARVLGSDGHCSALARQWNVTHPVSWQKAHAYSGPQAVYRDSDEWIDIDGVAIRYGGTEFSAAEGFIDCTLKAKAIS